MTRRTPPHDPEVEAALIGSMLMYRDATKAAIAQGVEPGDFYDPAYKLICGAVYELHRRNIPPDPIVVGNELRGNLTTIGGRKRLVALAADAPASYNARKWAEILHQHAEARRVLDISEQLATAVYDGTPVDELVEQLRHPTATTSSSWLPVDLLPILLADLTPPAPSVLARADGHALLYAGRVHAFVGESESLKSWLALLAVKEVLDRGDHVSYLDFEDTPEGIVSRLLALGINEDIVVDRFHYVRPLEQLKLGAAHHLDVHLTYTHPRLVVIDGVTEAMSLEGLDLLDNTDVATWLARLPRHIADQGPAVVMIDHVTKASDTRGRFAIGAQHKLAGIDGASYLIEPIHPLARANGSGPVTGISRITVAKDRPGGVRTYAANHKHIGELHITAWPDGGITTRIDPSVELGPGGLRPTVVMRRVSEAIEEAGTPLTKRALRGAVKAKHDVLELALELLVHEGYLEIETGRRGAQLHRLVRAFTEEHEPAAEDDEETLL